MRMVKCSIVSDQHLLFDSSEGGAPSFWDLPGELGPGCSSAVEGVGLDLEVGFIRPQFILQQACLMRKTLCVSEEFHSYSSELNQALDTAQKQLQYTNTIDTALLEECQACIKHMETEIQTMPVQLKRDVNQKLILQKKRLQVLLESKQKLELVENKEKRKTPTQELQRDLVENNQILDDIEKLTSDTEQIAVQVHGRLNQGTTALQNSKAKKLDIKSNIRKADLTINIMDRKVSVDKGTLYIIILLIGIIDVLAFFKRFR